MMTSASSADAGRVLILLAFATDDSQRTRHALAATTQLPDLRVNAAVEECVRSRHIVERAGGLLFLTSAGQTFAHALDARVPMAARTQVSPQVEPSAKTSSKPSGLPAVSPKAVSTSEHTAGKTASRPSPSVRDSASDVAKRAANVVAATREVPATPKPKAPSSLPAEVSKPSSTASSAQLPTLPPADDSMATSNILPLPNSHLMRVHKLHHPTPEDRARGRIVQAQAIYYMLGFNQHRQAIPIPILDGDILGRGQGADISFSNDLSVSRSHCQFKIKTDKAGGKPRMTIEDLDSTAGTIVNSARLQSGHPQAVKHGDHIVIGNVSLVVVEIPYRK